MDNFDKNMRFGVVAILTFWFICALAGLTTVGVIVWAIIKLVMHFLG